MASKSARKRRKRRPPPADASAPEQAGGTAAPQTAPRTEPQRVASRRAARGGDEPPAPPWGSFPLIELSVLVGIVMLIVGFFFAGGSRGPILIATGLLLGSIGGLELSIREHFAGYRSHTLILAGVPAMIVLGLLFYAGPESLPQIARAAIGVAVFGIAAFLLTRAFAARSGGLRYRFRPLSSPRR